MTSFTQTRAAAAGARIVLAAALICGAATFSIPAYARHDPDHDHDHHAPDRRVVHRVVHRDVHRDWHHDVHRDWHHYDHHDWHGRAGYYGAPPVVYGGPYYPPPPVDYGPGVSFNVPGISINF